MHEAVPGLGAAMSRREAIAAGGLAVAGVAIGPVPANRVILGATLGTYPKLHADVPRARGIRMYFDSENDFPPAWPEPYPGAWVTLSLRPNPRDLFSGKLDHRLKAIIDSAPAHAELTFWHENTTGNPLHYPAYVNNASAAIGIQLHGQRLCRGTKVRFGVITCGPAIQQIDWLAPGLDWYGDDLYEFPRLRGPDNAIRKAKLLARLDSNLKAWRIKSGRRWPAIRITETNSPFDSHRENWFTWMMQWLSVHNGSRMLTYWNSQAGAAQGGLSGPWPPSPQVIQRLMWLSEEYKGFSAAWPGSSPDARPGAIRLDARCR